MADVFISYSRRDTEFVRGLAEDLSERGKSVWLDVEGIADGEVFPEALQKAIETSAGFVFVISPESAVSPYCAQEVELALELNKRIVPVVHQSVADDALPEGIRVRNWIPGEDPAHSDRIVTALDHDLEHVQAHTRWSLKALEWDQRGRDRSLLLRGSELAAAERWLAAAAGKEPAPTELQRDYVRAAYAAARRRQRVLTGVSVAVAALSVVLVVYALVSRGQARHQRAVATSRQLAAQADAQLKTDPELSVLLATRAVRASHSPDALASLRDALDASPDRALIAVGGDQSCTGGNLLAYAPDGKTLAIGSCQGRVRLIDPATGHVRRDVKVSGTALSPTYSSDGMALAVGVPEGVAVLDPATLKTERLYRSPPANSNGIAISADSVATLKRSRAEDGYVWDRRTGRRHRLALSHRFHSVGVAFLGDGSRLVVSGITAQPGRPAGLSEFDTQTGKLVRQRLFPSEDGDGGIATVAPDGRSLVVPAEGPSGGRIVRWSLPGLHREGVVTKAKAELWELAAFSRDGRRLLLGNTNGTSTVVPAAGGPAELTLPGPPSGVDGAAFAPDGRRLATIDQSGTAHLWSADPTAQLLMKAPDGGALAAGADVVASSSDGKLTIAGAGGSVRRVAVPGAATDGSAFPDLDPSGRLVVGETGPHAVVSRLPSLRRVGTVAIGVNAEEAVDSVAFDPPGRQVALFGGVSIAPEPPQVVDTATGRARRLDGGTLGCAWGGGAFSGDGRRLVAVSQCGDGLAWDPTTGKLLKQFRIAAGSIAVDVATDGRRAAVGSPGGAITIVSLPSGRPVTSLAGHPGGTFFVKYAPGDRWLVTGGNDGVLTIFDTRTWHVVRRVPVTTSIASILPTRDAILVAGADGTVRRSSLCPACGDAAALLRAANAQTTRPLTALERRTYLG